MANKYSDIWETLKRDGKVTLAVPVPIQKRVLVGLRNLKDRDVAFKLLAAERKRKYILQYCKESARIRILLVERVMIGELCVEDL